ncbi:MAG TPA: hypothetical protein VFZ65_18455 [Planctomycetota bacterium]|nr:hypothetical protein [Planctomycetota bacterium]
MNPFLVAATCAACLLSASATAQLAGPGLAWSGSSGNHASSYLPSCQNLPVTAVPSETVTLTVWGDMLSPFGLFAAASGSQCIQIPGFGGGVVLDLPVVPVTAGLLTMTSPCLSCPPGHEQLQFVVPPGLPPGTSVALQAVALGAGNLSFTVAITGSI